MAWLFRFGDWRFIIAGFHANVYEHSTITKENTPRKGGYDFISISKTITNENMGRIIVLMIQI